MTPAIMFDLETLGKRPGCIVASIGAVIFDPRGNWIGETLHTHIDMEDSALRGFNAEPDTVKWWLGQDDNARGLLVAGQDAAVSAYAAIDGFCNFIASAGPDAEIWCNGNSFDIPILAAYFHHFHLPLPWNYWQERDLRTLKALNKGARIERHGTHHNALDDALHQARLVQHILTFNSDMDA
jgi:DNA polymerase III epsilon subunit-like protein